MRCMSMSIRWTQIMVDPPPRSGGERARSLGARWHTHGGRGDCICTDFDLNPLNDYDGGLGLEGVPGHLDCQLPYLATKDLQRHPVDRGLLEVEVLKGQIACVDAGWVTVWSKRSSLCEPQTLAS